MSANRFSVTSKIYQFALVDAFTIVPLSGNPCAIVMGADSLTSEEMLAMGRGRIKTDFAFLRILP